MSRSPARPRPAPFALDHFGCPDQLGIALPALVLGLRVAPVEFEKPDQQRAYRFKPGRRWLKLACAASRRPFYYHATVLKPVQPATLAKAAELLATTIALAPDGHPTLRSAAAYQTTLATIFGGAVGCDTSYPHLAPDHYPLDLDALPQLTAELPPRGNPDEWLEWDSGFQRAQGAVNRWALVVLGGNHAPFSS